MEALHDDVGRKPEGLRRHLGTTMPRPQRDPRSRRPEVTSVIDDD
jgi:hypothetical protein